MKIRNLALTLSSVIVLSSATLGLSGEIHRIRVDGAINPISAKFMIEAVDRAEADDATAVLIELDTPGGLLESTRDIVQRFMAADVPVIVYVSPAGARAGSAGVFITLAAHIAVMAPGSNIGAAHPVSIGGGGMPGGEKDTSNQGVMSEKMTNDAAAMIRSIAETRNRNIEWAEKAVRESDAITATDALEMNVIDLIIPDIDSLLIAIDGMSIKLAERVITLNTRNATVTTFEMSWIERMFNHLANPNIAYILMMLGTYGLIFELSNPGSILPGVVGGICLLLAFLAFQALPINTIGLLLILFGIILLLLEIKVTSYGILSIGGAASLLLGSLVLIDTDVPIMRVSIGVIIPAVIFTVVIFMFAIGLGLSAQSRKVSTGVEGLIGMTGTTLDDLHPDGQILVHGEYWQAVSKTEIEKGQKVKIIGKNDMVLEVEKV